MRRAAVALLALAVVGCGPPTHQEFVERASEVCDRHIGRLIRIAREGTSRAPLTEEQSQIWETAYFDAYEDFVDALTDLDRPRDDAAVERYLARLEELARAFQDRRFDQDEPPTPSTQRLAEDADLHACSPARASE